LIKADFMLKRFAKQLKPLDIYNTLKALVSAPSKSKSKEKSGEKSADWYDQSFENNEHWKCHYTKSRYHFLWAVIADRLAPVKERNVLEVGSGSGQLAALLKDKGLSKYCGLDFSPKRVAQARKILPEFEFVEADAFETTLFDDYPYDAVISTEFLEHVEGDLEVLGRIRKGTYFIGTVPDFPYTSHVRHFRNTTEVAERYASLFDDFRVDDFYANDSGKTFFILAGIKN
jgi:SAM-dependent methyltransferase